MSMLDVDWKGLMLPFAYLFVLGGSLMAFSTIYRKRKAAQSANLAPWFAPHLQRNIYMSLLHLDPESTTKEKPKKVPDSVIRAALLRRAVEDIHRIIQVRNAKQACSTLLQRGSVGDDLWQRFLRAEKEMEEELRDVVMEANALGQNWGQVIFQSANEIAANTMLRKRLDEIQNQVDAEKAWWEGRKDSMKDTHAPDTSDDGTKLTPKSSSDEEPVLVDAAAATPAKTATRSPSPAPAPASAAGTPASSKKKKGKK